MIVLILAASLGISLFGNHAYAMWVPLSQKELLEQSKTIFVGNVTSVTPINVQYQSQIARNGTIKQSVGPETMILDEYTVKVEEFLKNPQNYDVIKLRQATVGGVPSGPSTIGGFEVGDKVLFYLPKYDNQTFFPMQYLPESFKIPQFCEGKDVLMQKRLEGGSNFTVIQNGMKVDYGNFTANKTIQFLYDKDMNTLLGKSLDVSVGIVKMTGNYNQPVFSQNIHAESKPCQWVASVEWEYTPKEAGKYAMGIIQKEGGTLTDTSSTSFSVRPYVDTLNPMSPLQQFKSGISAQTVECVSNFQLILKTEDGSPACVSPNTAQILIERGWGHFPLRLG